MLSNNKCTKFIPLESNSSLSCPNCDASMSYNSKYCEGREQKRSTLTFVILMCLKILFQIYPI